MGGESAVMPCVLDANAVRNDVGSLKCPEIEREAAPMKFGHLSEQIESAGQVSVETGGVPGDYARGSRYFVGNEHAAFIHTCRSHLAGYKDRALIKTLNPAQKLAQSQGRTHASH